MAKSAHIPIKYKFLGVLFTIMFLGFSVFFYFVQKTFSEDKKIFVMELNLTNLKAITSEIQLALKGRAEELQAFVPRVYEADLSSGNSEKLDLFQGMTGHLHEEVLGVTFLKVSPDKKSEITKQFTNTELLKKNGYQPGLVNTLSNIHPLPIASLNLEDGMEILNRSVRLTSPKGRLEIPILTIILNGSFIGAHSNPLEQTNETLIVVDFLQDFLRKQLQESEMAEVFLINRSGTLLSHPSLSTMIDYARTPFDHPIVAKLKDKQFPRESFELEVGKDAYLCNISDSGFKNIQAVSQVKKSQAFVALKELMNKTSLIAVFILSFAVIFSIAFASGLTKNIKKLRQAAERIGTGDWNIQLDINTNDEIQNVADSFSWMATRLTELVKETAQKARMAEELETARLVQSTLLATPEASTDNFEVIPYYLPASECGGDFWDIHHNGDKLTLVIGDATGHGAPAAIVTAVAKSTFSTLNTIYGHQVLTPEQFLTVLNRIIFSLCKGKLLMTMCIVQIDLRTGDVNVCNAGHESPMALRKTDNVKNACEVLFARGERLGFAMESEYTSEHFKLSPGESILLYTDGVSEARNTEGKEFGERALKKTFSKKGLRPLPTVKEELIAAVKNHIEGSEQEDDITFVLVNWKHPIQKSLGKVA